MSDRHYAELLARLGGRQSTCGSGDEQGAQQTAGAHRRAGNAADGARAQPARAHLDQPA